MEEKLLIGKFSLTMSSILKSEMLIYQMVLWRMCSGASLYKNKLRTLYFLLTARKSGTSEVPPRPQKPWKYLFYECSSTVFEVKNC